MKRARIRVDPVNGFFAVVLIAALLALFLGPSATVQDTGVIVAFIAVAAIALGSFDVLPRRWGIGMQLREKREDDPLSEARHNVDTNPSATAEDWAKERAAYAEKQQRRVPGS